MAKQSTNIDQWRGGGISWRTYQEQYRQNPAPDEEEVLMIAETIKKRLMEQGIIDQHSGG